MNAEGESGNRLAAWFGVPSLWVFTAVVPFVITMVVTQSVYWGLVAILGTLLVIWVVTALGVALPVREQTGAGLPALAGWLTAAALVSDGWPKDSVLLEPVPVAVAVILLGTDLVLRRRASDPAYDEPVPDV